MPATYLAFLEGARGGALPLAFLEGIGAMEMILVMVIGLLLFGGKGLPDMARTFGRMVREFKKATAGVENEMKRVMNEEPPTAVKAPVAKPRGVKAAGTPSAGPGEATEGEATGPGAPGAQAPGGAAAPMSPPPPAPPLA
jgi:TatA/E family protein of Tat protein translocase